MAKAGGLYRGLGVLWVRCKQRGDEITDDMISRWELGIWRSLRRTWFHFVPSVARIAVLIAHHPLSLVSGCFLEFSAPHGLLHGFALYVPD